MFPCGLPARSDHPGQGGLPGVTGDELPEPEATWENTRVFGDPGKAVAVLKAEPGRDILVINSAPLRVGARASASPRWPRRPGAAPRGLPLLLPGRARACFPAVAAAPN